MTCIRDSIKNYGIRFTFSIKLHLELEVQMDKICALPRGSFKTTSQNMVEIIYFQKHLENHFIPSIKPTILMTENM